MLMFCMFQTCIEIPVVVLLHCTLHYITRLVWIDYLIILLELNSCLHILVLAEACGQCGGTGETNTFNLQ